MKRRQFILAAAIASLYAPTAIGKSKPATDFQYFSLIEASKQKAETFIKSAKLNSLLVEHSKSLVSIGYKPASHFFISSDKRTLFFPYDLVLNNTEIIDSQFLVLQCSDFDNFQKIAVLSSDFLIAMDLTIPALISNYSRDKAKSLLLPKAGKRVAASQLFNTELGFVSYTLRIFPTHKEHSVDLIDGSKNLSFSYRTYSESILS
jgi:hypothetical protein